MALHWRPVGPEPETTYWQRRAVVALAVLLALVLLLQLLGGDDEPDSVASSPVATASPSGPAPRVAPPASAAPSADTSADSSASPGASAVPSPTATVAPCAPGALDVTAGATERTYAVGSAPKLELRVTTSGTTACSVDLGQAAVELVVFSGPDRIWSSDDCAPGGGADVKALQPGQPDVSRVTWPGTRSRPGCAGAKEQAQPGTYRVTARIGEQRVEGEAFLLRG